MNIFEKVEGGKVNGYGFLVGGGSKREEKIIIRNEKGVEILKGNEGEDGSLRLKKEENEDMVLKIKEGEGNVEEENIEEERL